MKLLVIVRLINIKARDKLIPLLRSDLVNHVTLVRHAPVDIQSEKLTQVIHNSGLTDGFVKQKRSAQFKNIWLCIYHGLRIARSEHPQVVVGYNFVPYGVIAWLVARLSRRQVVVSLIGADFNSRIRIPILGSILEALLRNCDAVAIFGDTMRQELIEQGVRSERVFTLPNTADTDLYYPDPNLKPDTDLIFVGQLIERKRVDLLLHTLKKIHENRPQTNLLVIGDGSLRAELEALAQSIGVADRVEFRGHSDDVSGLLRRARVFVLFSMAEGVPMAALEAMCTGLPVVVTDVGAINTVVRDGENGYLLPSPADPSLAAERILCLLQDIDHYYRMRDKALAVRETHGYERTAQVWGEILSSLN